MTDLDRLLGLYEEYQSSPHLDIRKKAREEYESLYEKINDMEYKIKGLEAEVDILEKSNEELMEELKELEDSLDNYKHTYG